MVLYLENAEHVYQVVERSMLLPSRLGRVFPRLP